MRRLGLALALVHAACVPSDEGDDSPITMGMATGPADDSAMDPDLCFMDGQCDPLAPQCGGTSQCVSQGNDFRCQEPTPGAVQAGPGQPCQGALSCQAGLVCMPISVTGCTGSFGCCIPVCDLESPGCSAGQTCMPLFSDPAPVCFDIVGVCIEG